MHLRTRTIALCIVCAVLLIAPTAVTASDGASSARYGADDTGAFMTRWLTLGPIPAFNGPRGSETEEKLAAAFDAEQVDPRTLASVAPGAAVTIGGRQFSWKFMESAGDFVDFETVYGDSDFVIAYAWAVIESPGERRVLFGFGSDDAIKVWVNGELAHENWIARPVHEDDDLVPITLKKGANRLLVKIQDRADGWGFACRTIGPDLFPEKLISSAGRGSIDMVELLLENGADIDASSDIGLTAYQAARIGGRTEMAKLLAARGADTTIAMPSREDLTTALFEKPLAGRSAGAAVLVALGGEIVYQRGFGFADIGNKVAATPETVFRIGSITKQFTAAAILKLQEQGRLSVTDRLSKYFPGFPRGDEITLHHLLTHTSGIHSYTSQPGFLDNVTLPAHPDSMLAEIKGFDFDFEPGEQWSYNNSGYYLLGLIIESVSGKSYANYLEEVFFDPIHMDHTGVHRATDIIDNEATGYAYVNGTLEKALDWNMSWAGGAGALYSTVGDLHRWNEAVHGGAILSEASRAAASTPMTLNDGTTDTPLGGGYGYGIVIGELRGIAEISHGGGLHGFVSHLAWYPQEHLTICILSNCAPTHALSPGQMAMKLAEIYLWEKMTPVESYATADGIDPDSYDDYAGRYEFPMGGAILEITADGGRLFAQLSGQPKLELFPRSENEFFWKAVDASITFVRGADGTVTHAVHHQFGREFEAPRLAEEREAAVDPAVYDAYVGRYQLTPQMVLTITREDDRLFSQATGQPKVELFPKSETEFFLKIVKAEITFVPDESGTAIKLILNQGGRTIAAPRID